MKYKEIKQEIRWGITRSKDGIRSINIEEHWTKRQKNPPVNRPIGAWYNVTVQVRQKIIDFSPEIDNHVRDKLGISPEIGHILF